MGLISRFLDVFINPAKISDEIKQNPRWLEPLIIIFIFSIAFTLLTARIQSKDSVEYIKINPKMADRIPQERLEKMANPSKSVITLKAFVQTPIFVLIALLIFSALLLIIVKLTGGDGEFKHFWSLGLFSCYIDYVFGNGIKTILTLKKGTSIGISTGLSLFFPTLSITSPSYLILSMFDFFSIWSYIFIGIAVSKVSRISITKALIISGIIFVLKVIVSAFPTILFMRAG
ncbi:MAG: YIP1 family protein [Candidatus Aminicenantia bacterium]